MKNMEPLFMKIIIIVLIVLGLAFIAIRPANPQEFIVRDNIEYINVLSVPVNFKWDAVPGENIVYEIRALHVEQDRLLPIVVTANTNVLYSLDKVGHYTMQVRATDGHIYSEWASSDKLMYVVDAPWILYMKLTPPGEITLTVN